MQQNLTLMEVPSAGDQVADLLLRGEGSDVDPAEESTARFMSEFHRQGEAREYDEVGLFKQTFQWRLARAIPEAQF
jgi:hypothetical protein